MTSTISKIQSNGLFVMLAVWALALVLVACDSTPTAPRQHGFPAQPRVTTTSTQAETQEPSKPSPKQATTAPADNSDEDKPAPVFYGSTYWNEVLTSVYFYPQGGNGDAAVPATHLKFEHREDDIWLCGDQRKHFKPGRRYQLTVTFEVNQPCETNWQTE